MFLNVGLKGIPYLKLRFFSNPYLLGAVCVSVIMICSILYIPFLKSVFNTVSLNLDQWALVLFFSGIIFLINSVYLYIKSKGKKEYN